MEACKDILHLDLDAFYPSVEVLDNPELRGRAVVVGGGRQRGVVSSASYEARRFGVRSAQPVAAAMRLCPHGVFLPPRMDRYREVSERVLDIFLRFTPLVEPLSLDEAFLDVTGSTQLFGPPERIARRIKELVKEETGLTISAGVGPSKLVAKIASDLHKPDGLTVVPRDSVRQFLDPLPVERLWGVGAVTLARLKPLGVKTIGDLARLSPEAMERRFGNHGLLLLSLARGEDDREVEPGRDTKSLGNEETFADDIRDRAALRRELLALATKVARRVRQERLAGRTVTLKVKYSDFQQITRSITLTGPLDDGDGLYRQACALLDKTEAGRRPVRLLGLSLSGFAQPGNARQPGLFSDEAAVLKKKKLNAALDRISQKYGDDTIVPGTLIEKNRG